jgi:hypothetical protein
VIGFHLVGDVRRMRIGGYGMSPRPGRRIIQIAPIGSGGSDKPFCGTRYFKPCASIAYAMTTLEATG